MARPSSTPASSPTAAGRLDVAATLAGERLFLTGATGFVGKVLVERLLWSVPEVGKLLLLVRPGGGRSGEERLREEVLGSPLMARLKALHGEGWEEWAAAKLEAVEGDLGRERFGLAPERYAALARGVDRVVAAAATVTFDERLDRAVEINARGALRALALACEAGEVPLVQISTCFVHGRRSGLSEAAPVPERLPELGPDGGGDPDALLAALDEACRRLRTAATAGDEAAGDTDRRLIAAGAEIARRHGFPDVYTLTKALAERLLARHRGGVPLAVVRPGVIESAAAQPIPGWIEAVRVADPLLVAYGRGRTRVLPGAAAVPLELVPVDHVAHLLLAALAELPRGERSHGAGPEPRDIRIYQLGSGRNPITLGELLAHAREGFAAAPLRDEAGRPIRPRPVRLVPPERLQRALLARRRRLRRLAGWLGGRRPGRLAARLGRAGRTADYFLHLLEVYRPYLTPGPTYDDAATRALWDRLSAAERAVFPFDVATIDWRTYVSRVHVPGLVRFALRAETGAPPPPRRGPDPLAAPHARDLARSPGGPAGEARTVYELFAAVARTDPDAPAFQTCRDGRWLRYSYGQALAAVANLAHMLADRHGVGRGDRVVLWAGGCPEWALTLLALHRLGATAVPLDPQWPAPEVAAAARRVGAKLLCAAPRLAPALAGEPPCTVIALAAPFVPEPDAGLLPGVPAVNGGGDGAAGEPDDLALIVFTSGTTAGSDGARPKAVPLTHANLLANVRDLVPLMRLTRERLLPVLPVHHVFELMVGHLVPLAGGGSISYPAEIKPAEISWMMAVTRPTVLVAVPRLLELLHDGIRRNVESGGPALRTLFRLLFTLSRLTGGRLGHRLFGQVHRRFGGCLRRIATGGSALEPALGRSFQLMGFAVAEGYGMTETSPVLTVNPWDAIRFGTVGRPLPGVEIELRPPADGAAVGLEAGAGEIWVRGANVMAGYHDNPEATAEVMEDGWLATGDLGAFDADGYLSISGRSKDVIVTAAGKNVYPEEVERRYRDLPGVAELVVLGLPDGRGGERVTALVVPRAGASEEEIEEIRAAVAERSAGVPSYQQVAGIEVWRGELPKTTTMKVKRGLLRQAVLDGKRGEEASKGPAAAPPAATAPSTGAPPRSEAEEWVLATLARLTRTRPDLLRPADRLAELGVDSLTRVELVGEIEARFGLRVEDSRAAALGRVQDLFELTGADQGR